MICSYLFIILPILFWKQMTVLVQNTTKNQHNIFLNKQSYDLIHPAARSMASSSQRSILVLGTNKMGGGCGPSWTLLPGLECWMIWKTMRSKILLLRYSVCQACTRGNPHVPKQLKTRKVQPSSLLTIRSMTPFVQWDNVAELPSLHHSERENGHPVRQRWVPPSLSSHASKRTSFPVANL